MKNSKTGSGRIKTFFLYNIEKLILVVSLILLALFFYLGMSSEKFEKTPDSLVNEANQATSYIESDSNWKEIAMYRQGDVAVVDRVKAANVPVNASAYKIPGLSMVPKALQLRMDPPLPKVLDVEAHVLRSAVIVQNKQKGNDDPILKLPLARAKEDPDAKKRSSMRGSTGPSSEDMEEMMGDFGFAGGPPGSGGSDRKGRKKEKDPQEDAEVDAWWGLPGVQEAMQGGVRPKTVAAAGSDIALTRNIVIVNALVDHKSLWKQHEQTLSSSLGYYPKRDLPRYDYLQVERREVKNGQPSQWKDISTFVNFKQADLYPSSFTSAPEVVPAENYDQDLTNAIPPILGTDYADAVIHSKLTRRVFKVPEDDDKGVATADVLEGKEELEKDEHSMRNPLGEGIRRRKKGLGGAGGGMMGGFGGGMRGGLGGMEGMDGGYGMGFGMRTGDGRSSSDLREYEELANPVLEPTADFKQVRFFDMSVTPNKKAVYEYRMRVWVADPNNADDKANTGMDDFGAGGMDEMMGMGGRGGMMGKKKEDEKKVYKKTKINFTMQDQSVRNRIKRGRHEGPMDQRVYFVSEVYEGSNEPVEIKVPEGEEYLRFARPTPWSDTVKVAVEGSSADFFAQKVSEPRTARVGTTEIPVDEPKAEIVTSVEDSKYQGTKIAAMRLFSIGDLLNFTEPVTILHPVAQSIHFIEEANLRSGGVLIDVMGGNRLEIARNDPIQYDLPGETLIMDSKGMFIISNDIEDLKDARHALRLPDEKAEYGGKKAARRAEQEASEKMRNGGFPGFEGP